NSFVIIIFLIFPGQAPETTLEKLEKEVVTVVERTRPSVVQVQARVDKEVQPRVILSRIVYLSGIVVSADGGILTDLGAVEQARELRVTLPDGRQLPAEFRGGDRRTAVAFLRVKAEGLRPVEFADDASIRQGMLAIALANPAGLKGSCSVGFVSGLNRTVSVQGTQFDDLIQTTALLQPGDAGGLLANSRGLVVGMVHSRYVTDGFDFGPGGFLRVLPGEGLDFLPAGGQSVGFATPAPTLRFVAERLMKSGKVVRGWVGIAVRPLDAASRARAKVAEGRGALVSNLEDRGPAARAGLRRGDILVDFDGEPVSDLSALRRRVVEAPAPKVVRVRAWRAGVTVELDLTIEEERQP
ncbi:MAG TPA: trypsin-like peptidase domain-containing protein, partial [Planctomycetota bacterium]